MSERLSFNGAGVELVGLGDVSPPCPPDPRELPSSRSAIDFVDGVPGAFFRMCAHTAVRSAIIGVGLYATGDRTKRLWLHALGGGVAIEAAAMVWVLTRRPEKPPQ